VSGLTVKDCFKMFPTMQFKDMEKIMGTPNFTDTDVISANAVARYTGKFEHPLSIFYAKNDTEEFIPLLSGQKQKNIMEQAGISSKDVQGINNIQNHNGQNNIAQTNEDNLKDTSIFNIARASEEYPKNDLV